MCEPVNCGSMKIGTVVQTKTAKGAGTAKKAAARKK